MTIDPAAAAYGIFQVVFAEMTENLAGALFRFRQVKQPELTFKQVFRMVFNKLLKEFEDDLKPASEPSALSDSLSAVRDACAAMKSIADWRNDRIHARVRQGDGGLALYNWRTGEPLPITYEECENQITQAIKVIVILEAHVPSLVGSLNMPDLIKQLLQTPDPLD